MPGTSQRDLFDLPEDPRPHANAAALGLVGGLAYVPGVIGPEAQARLLAEIDALPWLTELRRRVQHHGYRYDYRSRSVDRSMRLGDLPVWASAVADRLMGLGLIDRAPDQLIVNEYEPGQGISSHVDCEPCFDGNVASVSLGSACVMNLAPRGGGEAVPLLLEPGSVVVLTGDARYQWTHGIPARKSDVHDSRRWMRSRRVSLTFRKVILADGPTGVG